MNLDKFLDFLKEGLKLEGKGKVKVKIIVWKDGVGQMRFYCKFYGEEDKFLMDWRYIKSHYFNVKAYGVEELEVVEKEDV